ncbi:FixH family protein [Roseivivax sediminis]|uniref:Nitrogen fixation protein FixH n=1 Tax=Roseivivax sediminis TaxID=936889 RepID=A0A1I1YRR5_9RHOB|nr:FixH family protein [Roseivivax sediminis]SFE22207.1 Nitrogen fixation protein FixH [Roseivivax sediminis]
MTDFTLKGRHVLAMFVLGFGTIIAVNLTLAVNAVRTFPGLETANSYVASQEYDDRRAAQEALGWTVEATGESGVAAVALVDAHGLPADLRDMQAVIGRATTDDGERVMPQTGRAAAALEMPEGYWRVDVIATAPDGTAFEQRLTLHVTP